MIRFRGMLLEKWKAGEAAKDVATRIGVLGKLAAKKDPESRIRRAARKAKAAAQRLRRPVPKPGLTPKEQKAHAKLIKKLKVTAPHREVRVTGAEKRAQRLKAVRAGLKRKEPPVKPAKAAPVKTKVARLKLARGEAPKIAKGREQAVPAGRKSVMKLKQAGGTTKAQRTAKKELAKEKGKAALAVQTVKGGAEATKETIGRFARRHKGKLAAAGLTGLAAVGYAAHRIRKARQAKRARETRR